MMDSGIAYDTKPRNDRAAVISVSSVEKTAPKGRLKEKTEKAIVFLQSEETAEKVNSLKEKAASAVNQAEAKTSDIVSGMVSFLQSEETAEKVNSLKEKAASAVNQVGAKTSDIVSGTVSFLQSEETTEKVNVLKEKAASAVTQAGAKTSGIVSDVVSFFKSEPSDKKSVTDEENIRPVFENPTFYQQNYEKTFVRNPQSVVLYAIIGVLSLIIVIGGIILFTYIRRTSKNQDVSVSNAPAEPGQNQVTENFAEIPETGTSVLVSVISQNSAVLLSSGTGTTNEKVYQNFYQILSIFPVVICMTLTMTARMI